MFNVKDLRAYHGEDLRASLFSQLWGIDAGASINTLNIGNSALIIEELDWGGHDTLNTCENSSGTTSTNSARIGSTSFGISFSLSVSSIATKAITFKPAMISFSNSDFDNKEFYSAGLEAGAIAGFNDFKTILCSSLRNV